MNEAFFRYLTMGEDSTVFGVHVINIGYAKYGENMPYPESGHPKEYTFSQKNGRVLTGHHLVYITRGKGIFWTEAGGKTEVPAGTMILLFPGVRHYYRPDPETGWDEYWVGFSGDHACRIMESCFDPTQPVLEIGNHPELLRVFMEMCELVCVEVFGFRRIIAAKAVECIARLQILAGKTGSQTPEQENLVRDACSLINGAVEKAFAFRAYASEKGISYTAFRRLFKEHTGLPPHRYLLDMRLRKAQELLSNTTPSIQAISGETGFESSFYFSTYFKQRTGISPLKYRKQGR